jgi:hypothetical protein
VIRLKACAVGAVATVLLVGCTSAPSTQDDLATAAPTEEAVNVPVVIPDGIVASGELVRPDGSVFGTAELEKSDDGLIFHLPDLAPLGDPAQLIIALADGPVTMETCAEDNIWAVGITGDWPMARALQVEGGDDPSFYRHLLVVPYGTGEGCAQPILALATLDWDVPQTRPWIEVADSGPVTGAQGGVLVESGRPLVYRTAAGDAWDAIAARFGLTPDDLAYLNPIRLGNAEPGVAYADQLLNLDPTNRGDSETRRPGSELSQSGAF